MEVTRAAATAEMEATASVQTSAEAEGVERTYAATAPSGIHAAVVITATPPSREGLERGGKQKNGGVKLLGERRRISAADVKCANAALSVTAAALGDDVTAPAAPPAAVPAHSQAKNQLLCSTDSAPVVAAVAAAFRLQAKERSRTESKAPLNTATTPAQTGNAIIRTATSAAAARARVVATAAPRAVNSLSTESALETKKGRTPPSTGGAAALATAAEEPLLLTLPQDLLKVLPLYLDAYALLKLSMSSKSMQLLYGPHSEGCWRLKCLQLLGRLSAATLQRYRSSWYLMYLQHPRVRMDGIYISRSVYLRKVRDVGNLFLSETEQESRLQRRRLQQQLRKEQHISTASLHLFSSLSQSTSAPLLAVSYHRYLRFIPGTRKNRVLVLRTEADKSIAVQTLRVAEQRLREVERHESNNPLAGYSELANKLKSIYLSTNNTILCCTNGGGRSGATLHQQQQHQREKWLSLLPFVAVGEYIFDAKAKSVQVFYNEPTSKAVHGMELEEAAGAETGESTDRSSNNLVPRRRVGARISDWNCTSSFRSCFNSNTCDSGGHGSEVADLVSEEAQPQRRCCAVFAPGEAVRAPEAHAGALTVTNVEAAHPRRGQGGWCKPFYTHRAVLKLCDGASVGRANTRLQWISFSIRSRRKSHADDGDSENTTFLNLDSEHFRPFTLNLVHSYESFF